MDYGNAQVAAAQAQTTLLRDAVRNRPVSTADAHLDSAMERVKELTSRLELQASLLSTVTDRLLGERPGEAKDTVRPVRVGRMGVLLDGLDDLRDLVARIEGWTERLPEIG